MLAGSAKEVADTEDASRSVVRTQPCEEPIVVPLPCKVESAPVQPIVQAQREVMPVIPALGTSKRNARVPKELLENTDLNNAIATALPETWDFEVHRTIHRLRRVRATHVGLQMPEGVQRWATALADILRMFVPTLLSVTIFGEVSYGACCVDDLASKAVGIDVLIHYGHSCIVPVDQTTITTFYIHVTIKLDVQHLVETIQLNFSPDDRITFMGSVQFTGGMREAVDKLKDFFSDRGGGRVPQVKPLGPGETLGCTSPHITDSDALVFVCDGRFHLESAMIQNPHLKDAFYRYDPFQCTLTKEGFGFVDMHRSRRAAVEKAKEAKVVGLVLGTLGRQGSPGVLEEVERLLEKRGLQHFTLLATEVLPERLALFKGVDAWVQVACPRLSLDWGDAFSSPLLTPYEAHIAFGSSVYQDVYPMDYYSNKGGPWANYGSHNGYGGTLSAKFRHLGSKAIRYEEPA